MSEKKDLLLPIFEPELSLDNKKSGKSRSLHLFEQMAARLDEIAANTRGWAKGIFAHTYQRSHDRRTITEAKSKKYSKPVIATQKKKQPASINNEIAKTASKNEPVLAFASKNLPNAQTTLQNQPQSSNPSGIGSKTPQEKKSDKKRPPEDALNVSQPRSAIANNEAKEKRLAEENGNHIAEAVLSGIDKIGNLFKSGSDVVSQDSDIKDAAGYGLGGPFYGALKEIKEALPDVAFNNNGDEKDRKSDSRKLLNAIQNGSDRQRDDKGRFVKPDPNEARRQIAQTEVAEAQLALDEKETKKEEKRHKELIRAVKANKRGMLDRFLDKRIGLNRPGRERIIKERTVYDKGKSGAKAVHAKGPKQDSRLLPNNGSIGRLSRETDIGNRAKSKGILSRAGGVAQSAGKAVTGTLAMGGKALGGMLRILPGIGQALALGMAAYEGFQGWNDKELHKQAFGLQEGQEATTGQKASAATASFLDVGGLTSGLLGMFGIEFDKAGVAKSIYEFGSSIATVARGFKETAGPLLSQVWGGIGDLASKAWQGAQDVGGVISNFAVGVWEKGSGLIASLGAGVGEIGGSIANFATTVWNKGSEFAGSIATWAGSAVQDGVGILSGIWKGASDTVGAIWANLSNFATSALTKAGEVLSGLWKNITELPGKIIDGAKDLAKGAIDNGNKLLSDGWNAVKSWGKGLFSGDEANAAPTNQAQPIPPDLHKAGASLQKDSVSITPKIAKDDNQEAALSLENQATLAVSPFFESKLSQLNTNDIAQKSITSSESASSALALEQMKQNDIENKSREEIIDNLELANKNINNVSKLLEEEFRKGDLPDEFGIAGALQNVSSAIQGARGGGYAPVTANYAGGGSGSASFAYNPDSKLGDTIARFESGTDGVHKIGYDRQGGTSYGKWQLSSRQGSYEEWLKLLESKGGQHAEIARQLRAAGPTNTGSRSGQHVEVYKKLAAENAQLFEETQRESLMKHNYNIAMSGIKSDSLRKMIADDKSLQEMMFSTSVQHGGGGARKIFNGVYQEGMSREQFINAVYAKRGGQFGSSPELSKGLNNRFREERDVILGMKKGEENARAIRARLAGGGSDAVNAGMSTMVAAATQTAIDNNVKYKMGAKNSEAGQIDCSGWVTEVNRQMMSEMNRAMGAEVFGREAQATLRRGAEGGAAGIIKTVGEKTGKIYNNAELSPENVREGMAIGMSLGKHAKGRFRDIGHIVQTYRDPETGEMMVSESTSGKGGVTRTRYSDWYARYQKRGVALHGVDMTALADVSKVAPVSPQSIADNSAHTAPESIQAATNAQRLIQNTAPQVVEAQVASPQKEELEAARAKVAAAEKELENTGFTEEQALAASKEGKKRIYGSDFSLQMHNKAIDAHAVLQSARENLNRLESQRDQAIAATQTNKLEQGKNAATFSEEKQGPQIAAPLAPATPPVSLAQATNVAPIGMPTREPIPVPSIREIDPEREIKTSSNDNGPILKILGEILAAIQAGNKKMGNSGNNEGPPFISTEYDDPAAQGLAADTA